MQKMHLKYDFALKKRVKKGHEKRLSFMLNVRKLETWKMLEPVETAKCGSGMSHTIRVYTYIAKCLLSKIIEILKRQNKDTFWFLEAPSKFFGINTFGRHISQLIENQSFHNSRSGSSDKVRFFTNNLVKYFATRLSFHSVYTNFE